MHASLLVISRFKPATLFLASPWPRYAWIDNWLSKGTVSAAGSHYFKTSVDSNEKVVGLVAVTEQTGLLAQRRLFDGWISYEIAAVHSSCVVAHESIWTAAESLLIQLLLLRQLSVTGLTDGFSRFLKKMSNSHLSLQRCLFCYCNQPYYFLSVQRRLKVIWASSAVCPLTATDILKPSIIYVIRLFKSKCL